jgi:hypothetical protein
LRTVFLAFALCVVLATPASASVVVGSGFAPDVAVDGAGVAHIAWRGGETGSPPHYCRLPRGASACDVALTLDVTPNTDSVTRPAVTVSGARVTILVARYGQQTAISQYTSLNGGASFGPPQVAAPFVPIYGSVAGPGDSVSIVSQTETGGMRFVNVPLGGPAPAAAATLDAQRPYNGAVGLDGQTPIVVASDGSSNAAFRRYIGGDLNSETSWAPAVPIGFSDYTRLASGVAGLFMLTGDGSRGIVARRFDGSSFGAPVPVGPGFSPDSGFFQDPAGRLHAVYPMLDAFGYHAMHAVSDDGAGWRVGEIEPDTTGQPGAMRVSAAADHVGVAVWRGAGSEIKVAGVGPEAPAVPPPVVVQPPPTPTPTPDPLPLSGKSVVVKPVSGVVQVRLKGSSKFVPLTSLDDVPLGATIDTRKGRIELRSVPKAGAAVETVQLYQGMFRIDQKRGITNFTLNEPLAPCSKRGRAAAKKPKTRRLWGDGKGHFRTSGKYSAATVRGTRWLVRDSCAGTLTKVTQGSVTVAPKGKKRRIIVRPGKPYLARAKR